MMWPEPELRAIIRPEPTGDEKPEFAQHYLTGAFSHRYGKLSGIVET